MLYRNKTKLLPSSYPEVYEVKCTCNSAYFGETKKKILTRTIEHQQDSFKGKWDNSEATEHSLTCHGQLIESTQKPYLEKTITEREKYGKR